MIDPDQTTTLPPAGKAGKVSSCGANSTLGEEGGGGPIPILPQHILDSINEGIYVTDLTRRIIYWNKSAERITGWAADEIVGKHCYDDVLCHVDKDGHQLCGMEHCPLHRAMVTNSSSHDPVIVFAKTKSRGRVPLQVSVSPLMDAEQRVIGGVENFRDLSSELADMERARQIQRLTLHRELPHDPRVRFRTHYIAHDVVGGDYFAIAALDENRYGFLLADVMGHGVQAALYTMCLNSLWQSDKHLLVEPAQFAKVISDKLHAMIHEDTAFAVALCGVLDLRSGQLRLVGAGNPPPLVLRANQQWEQPEANGVPLGLMEGAEYEELVVPLGKDDRVLLFTDGAVEATAAGGTQFGEAGLMAVLREVNYEGSDPNFNQIEARMLAASDRVRFDDDVTFIEIRVN